MKTTEMIDGVRVLKLAETHPEELRRDSDSLALYKIWSHLTAADMSRDMAIDSRLLK